MIAKSQNRMRMHMLEMTAEKMLLGGHFHVLRALPSRECSKLHPRGMSGSGSHAAWQELGNSQGFGFVKPVAVKPASLPHSDSNYWRLPGEPRPSALVAEVSQIKPRCLSRFPLQHPQLLQALFQSRVDFSF